MNPECQAPYLVSAMVRQTPALGGKARAIMMRVPSGVVRGVVRFQDVTVLKA